MSVRTYDPGKVIITLFGATMSGFADGSFIKVARSSETFTKKVGADGKAARVRSRDASGTITLTLMQTSPSNDVLSAVADIDERVGTGVGSFLMTDLNGTSQASAPSAWITKPAELEEGKDLNDREWVIDVDDLDVFVGSNFAL